MPDPEPKPEPQPVPVKTDWNKWGMFVFVFLALAVGSGGGTIISNWLNSKINPATVVAPTTQPLTQPKPEPPPKVETSYLTDNENNNLDEPFVKPLLDAIPNLPDGTYHYVGLPKKGQIQYRTITVSGGTAPQPPPNVPPVKPDIPAPVNPGEFKVIIAYESSGNLTQGQVGVSTNPELRTFLNEKCTKDASGHPMFRIWDRDVAITTDKALEDVWTAVKPKLSTDPKVMELIIFQNGTAAIHQIKDATEALELCKKVVK